MLPTQKEIEVPLLQVLAELGGQAHPKDIYALVAKKFPLLRDEDMAETVPSGGNRFSNRVQWARQQLVTEGELDSPSHGTWRITDKGRQRLGAGHTGQSTQQPPTFLELYEQYEASFRGRLLELLYSLSPHQFEQFGRRILLAYGFVDVKVTQVSKDGGIDGYGKLRLGLATMKVAFQCKRWQGNVGRPEVDKFRGAIQGEFEQGVFFATSDFTAEARDASLKSGAVPVILLNGEGIVTLMIEKGIGVQRVPLYAYYEQPGELTEDQG